MKKLFINTILFLMPVLVIIIIMPVNKRLKYQGLEDDCFNHGIWIYDRIFNNETPIDIAFLGSSHTINGINDTLITENTDFGIAVNLGYCRLGRNLTYVFLKELIAQKNIKHLVLEVREDEDRYSHPVFPFLANTKDVLFPNPFFNKDILNDIWTHLTYKVEVTQDYIYQQNKTAPFRPNDYGFASSKDTISGSVLDEVKIKRQTTRPPLNNFERYFYMSFARRYLSKIYTLCCENNIQITFLYLPSYGSRFEKPKEYETYKKYGDIIIVPKHILENQNNWHDENHMNQTGANALSEWLCDYINNNWK